MKKLIAVALCCASLGASVITYALDVEVKGLFKNAAVLIIDGEQYLLKTGAKSPEGVRLVSANSREAVIDIDGVKRTVGVSQRISSRFTVAQGREVRLAQSRGGHYITPGRINGLPVEFMVDTGATYVAMNLSTAKKLGINYRAGEEGHTRTANGVVTVYNVLLDKVSVGEVEVRHVRASITLTDFPQTILLGNSYLSRVNMTRDHGVLILSTQK